jgi:hypothetical protein
MAPENPSKTPNPPGFHDRARPGMAIPASFWAKKLILVIIHHSIQLSIARFLGDPASFNIPGPKFYRS